MNISNKAQVNNLVLFAIVLLVAVIIFNVIGISLKLFGVMLALIVFFIAFFNPRFAMVILIFSMLLSPEFMLGQSGGAGGGRPVVLRLDDIFLLLVFAGWFCSVALNKEMGLFRPNPLNEPIFIYIAICCVCTLLGIFRSTVTLKSGSLYLLKYIEYFILFFMVSNIFRERQQARTFVFLILTVGLIISLFAWVQHLQGIERVSTPFEGKEGEANTLGGYLVLIIIIALSILLNTSSLRQRQFLAVLLILAVPSLLFTLSRGSWLAFIPAFFTLFLLTKKGKALIFIVGMSVALLAPFLFSKAVQERVRTTFSIEKQYEFGGRRLSFDESTAARIDSWQEGLTKWSRAPFFGTGVGSAGPAVDNQYTRILIETGLLGFIAFVMVMVAVFRNALNSLQRFKDDGFFYGLIAGFIAAFFGLLVHGFSAATFIIIRIMEPFWFLTAIIVMLPEVISISPNEN